MGFLWTLFSPIVTLIERLLTFFYNISASFGYESYGLAIILLTIVIKIILYPLTAKQVKSMKAMQELQPEMKRLQTLYKDNPPLLQQEISKLYQSKGVNPFAGCLPMLIQMPLLMGIYYALRDMNYQGDPSFLWLPSLAETDPTYIFPFLSMATTFLVQQQTMGSQQSGDQKQMKIMLYMMPLFIGWMSVNLSSGLVVYWVTMNAVQIIQQFLIFRAEEKAQVTVKEKVKKDKKKNKN